MLLAVLLLGGMAVSGARAQQSDVDRPVAAKGSHDFGIRIGNLKVGYDDGGAVFLFGAFCALWAQNTRRNPWLWFFMGLFFNVITVIVLLVKNSDDNFDLKQYGRTTQGIRTEGNKPL